VNTRAYRILRRPPLRSGQHDEHVGLLIAAVGLGSCLFDAGLELLTQRELEVL
jgi:hypothetical protein